MNLINQKPQVFEIPAPPSFTGADDPVAMLTDHLINPLYEPLAAGNVSIMDDQNQPVEQETLTALFLSDLQDKYNADAESLLKPLLCKGFLHLNQEYIDSTLNVRQAWIAQMALKEKLPLADQKRVFYTSDDLIESSKKFLRKECSADYMCACFAQYANADTLAVYLKDAQAFADLKNWISVFAANMQRHLSVDCSIRLNEFLNLSLNDLCLSLWLREDDAHGNEEYSFARIMHSLIMAYAQQSDPSDCGIMPFSLSELYHPRSLVFINVERHAHMTRSAIRRTWNYIQEALQNPVRVLPLASIQRLDAAVRAKSHGCRDESRGDEDKFRSENLIPYGKIHHGKDLVRLIAKLISTMKQTRMSHNFYQNVSCSYMKASRRHPDDLNIPGKVRTTRYRPDLHLYLDTSGSISEENYEETVKACILLAKKLNINLYFNSFSDVLSECRLLKTSGKSSQQIYRIFQGVPKVGGGTDFHQIWRYISASPKRKKELSIIITDFCYTAPSYAKEHPENLYYLPCSALDPDELVHWAKIFEKSMLHIDPDIRSHILF